jgi:hypothetical protein
MDDKRRTLLNSAAPSISPLLSSLSVSEGIRVRQLARDSLGHNVYVCTYYVFSLYTCIVQLYVSYRTVFYGHSVFISDASVELNEIRVMDVQSLEPKPLRSLPAVSLLPSSAAVTSPDVLLSTPTVSDNHIVLMLLLLC